MEWLAENSQNAYALLAFAAFMLAGVWWIQKQIIYLLGAGVALVLLLVCWLVLRNVPTTVTRIETDLKALAAALLAKEKDKALGFVVDDLKYRGKGAEKWYSALEEIIDDHNVDALDIAKFEVKSRSGDEASVFFHLEAHSKKKKVYFADCPWKLTREGDVWKVHKVTLRGASDRKGKKDEED